MNRIIIIAFISSISFLFSCNKDKPDPGATAAVNMADEWWVQQYLNGVAVTTGPKHFYSYNTSANDNTMWFDDRGTLGTTKRFKAICVADYSALTFSANNVDNIGPALVGGLPKNKVTITGGKIMKGVGHSKMGNKTDSIFFNIQYSDDPGKTYTVSGHARTFFIDDDY